MVEDQQKTTLLNLAREVIQYALDSPQRERLPIKVSDYSDPLRQERASFVTLSKSGQLRGCIGSLEAQQALVLDVAHNAYSAAFHDPRFPPVRHSELDQLSIKISVLQPAETVIFNSERNLLEQLRPGQDGLILQCHGQKATFLPSVWEQLPDKKQFLQHLKLKANLSADYWSDDIQIFRYSTESF